MPLYEHRETGERSLTADGSRLDRRRVDDPAWQAVKPAKKAAAKKAAAKKAAVKKAPVVKPDDGPSED